MISDKSLSLPLAPLSLPPLSPPPCPHHSCQTRVVEETIIINGDAHKRNENYLSNILWGSHRGSAAATEVTARCQNLPKRIYPKVNSYAKNPMKTAAEGNNVFKMLNDPPLQRHKLGTIILNGDAHKRKGNHLSNILWVLSHYTAIKVIQHCHNSDYKCTQGPPTPTPPPPASP